MEGVLNVLSFLFVFVSEGGKVFVKDSVGRPDSQPVSHIMTAFHEYHQISALDI